MSELEKKFIAEALKKKYEDDQIQKEKSMIEGYLVDDEGNPVVQE